METLERVSVCFPLRIFLLLLVNLVTSPITGTSAESLFGVIYGTTYLWFAIMSVYFDIVVQNSKHINLRTQP